MDYLDIVLSGLNNPEYLDRYFFRKFKKAEKEFFEAEEFFGRCLEVVDSFDKEIIFRYKDRKNELSSMLNLAKNGTLRHNDNTKTDDEQNKETIEWCESELLSLNKYNFPISLYALSNGKYTGNLSYNEVVSLKKAILAGGVLASKEKADKASKQIQAKEQVKPKMTAPLLALCLYFLKESNYIRGTLEQMTDKTKELLDVSDFAFTTIKREYYQIGKGEKDPLNTDNLLNALGWLQNFPEATKKAKAILKTFE